MIYNEPVEKIYRCTKCIKWFRVGMIRKSCAVAHRGDGCCHYGETEVEEPEI